MNSIITGEQMITSTDGKIVKYGLQFINIWVFETFAKSISINLNVDKQQIKMLPFWSISLRLFCRHSVGCSGCEVLSIYFILSLVFV